MPRPPRARASRCNRRACRPAWSARPRGRAAGAAGRPAWRYRPLLEPGNVRMAPDRAGRGAGRVEQDRIERLPPAIRRRRRRQSRRRGRRRARLSRSRLSRAGERSTAVTCAPASASCAVLPPGAAHRSATRGRARRRTAAPAARPRRPAPTMRPRQIPAAASPRHARSCAPSRSARPGRARRSAQALGSLFTVRSSAGSWRWRPRWRAPFRLAIGGDPALHQPFGRIERGRVELAPDARRLRARCRRSTALTRPAKCAPWRSACTRRTARSTAA